ncbi:MAG: AAA family ATPase, partial [Candidatus Brocadiia bacterium]|nr:AAA family ATPase [Candidatus Brocadiia bacterium]
DMTVDAEDIGALIASWTGIPVDRLLEGEAEKLLHMEERLHERIIGQESAIVSVADAVRRARAGLSDSKRPIGSFIVLGPTGVGKTELARALGQYLFDDEENMIRVDMSEYGERHAVSRLIGSPPRCALMARQARHERAGRATIGKSCGMAGTPVRPEPVEGRGEGVAHHERGHVSARGELVEPRAREGS